MGMTEKQGGSDVLSNTTRAERLADGAYRLVGHKWFFSVPQSDAHLVLAQAKGGLSVSSSRAFYLTASAMRSALNG